MSVPQDIRSILGYVTYPGGPLCGNCRYAALEDARCLFKPDEPFDIDLQNGCCNRWLAADGRGEDFEQDVIDSAQASKATETVTWETETPLRPAQMQETS